MKKDLQMEVAQEMETEMDLDVELEVKVPADCLEKSVPKIVFLKAMMKKDRIVLTFWLGFGSAWLGWAWLCTNLGPLG